MPIKDPLNPLQYGVLLFPGTYLKTRLLPDGLEMERLSQQNAQQRISLSPWTP